MALNIKDPETERLASEVSSMTGESKTRAIRKALEERKERLAFQVNRREKDAELRRFLQESGLVPIPFGEAHWREAVEAYARFGRGRHRAGLNFGDCLSYATARLAGRPLLCVGDDFKKTDLALA